MLPDLHRVVATTYDPAAAFDLYQQYQAGEGTREGLLLTCLPLVGMVLRREFWDMDEDEREDAVQEGYLALDKVVDRPGIGDGPSSFRGYLYSCVRRRILTGMVRDNFDFGYQCAHPPCALIVQPAQIEGAIFLRELGPALREWVEDRIRFPGSEGRACLYAASCLIEGVGVPLAGIVRDFHLSKARAVFLVGYATVLFRMGLNEMRS